MSEPILTIMMVGKTGNGKSATGNTILGRPFFDSSSSSTSATKNISYSFTEYKGRMIKIVDTPGLADTSTEDLEEAIDIVVDQMKDAVILNPDGFHAFLLVFKFGVRITKEEEDCVRLLKGIFGKDFAKTYCIIVFTNGDHYEADGELKENFQQWIKKQEGCVKDFAKEFGDRFLLFNNKNIAAREQQLEDLMTMIDSLESTGQPYTDKHFKQAKDSRAMIQLHLIQEDTLAKIMLLEKSMVKLVNDQGSDDEAKLNKLKRLYHRNSEIIDVIQRNGVKTGIIAKAYKELSNINTTVSEGMFLISNQCNTNSPQSPEPILCQDELKRDTKLEVEMRKSSLQSELKTARHGQFKVLMKELLTKFTKVSKRPPLRKNATGESVSPGNEVRRSKKWSKSASSMENELDRMKSTFDDFITKLSQHHENLRKIREQNDEIVKKNSQCSIL